MRLIFVYCSKQIDCYIILSILPNKDHTPRSLKECFCNPEDSMTAWKVLSIVEIVVRSVPFTLSSI